MMSDPVRPMRVYVETSVFGGAFDPEFEATTRRFFDEVRAGRFILVTSVVVEQELRTAPPAVSEFFAAEAAAGELLDIGAEAFDLRDAYLAAGILRPQWSDDALHVALATTSGCRLIVSWNFRHIVHFGRIPLYNAVSVTRGYALIGIYSPASVITYEEDV